MAPRRFLDRMGLALRATLVALLIAGGLTTRLLSPAGFMPAIEQGGLVIVPCPDQSPEPMAMSGMAGHAMPHSKGSDDKGGKCDFASLDHQADVTGAAAVIAAVADLRPAYVGAFDFEYSPAHARWLHPPTRAPPLA